MRLEHEFVVTRPVDQAWQVLTDVERIVPCMPGAQLTEVDGDVYRGVVKVKVGPMLAQFAGQASFHELDPVAHRAVLAGRGKEGSGRGMASMLVTAQLAEQGEQTHVGVVIDLTISGRLAQFGQGTMAEVSSKLLGQFVSCLERDVLAAPPRGGGVRGINEAQAEPVDLLRSAGVPVFKRLVPVLVVVAVVIIALVVVLA